MKSLLTSSLQLSRALSWDSPVLGTGFFVSLQSPPDAAGLCAPTAPAGAGRFPHLPPSEGGPGARLTARAGRAAPPQRSAPALLCSAPPAGPLAVGELA